MTETNMERMYAMALEASVKTTVTHELADGSSIVFEMPNGARFTTGRAAEEREFRRGQSVLTLDRGDEFVTFWPMQPGTAAKPGQDHSYRMIFKERPLEVGDWVKWAEHPDALPMRADYVASAAQDGRGAYWSLRTSNGGNIGAFERDLVRVDAPAPTGRPKFVVGDIVQVPGKYFHGWTKPRAMVVTEVMWRWSKDLTGEWVYILDSRKGDPSPHSFAGASVADLTKLRQWPIRVGDFVRANYPRIDGLSGEVWKVSGVDRHAYGNSSDPDQWLIYGKDLAGVEHSDEGLLLDQVDVKVTKTDRKVTVTYDEKWEVQA
jgi:hypothetical protein